MNTPAIILIITYIPLVLLARWLNYKRAYDKKVLFFRSDLDRGFWFIPVINLIYVLQQLILIWYDNVEHGDNKFFHWLFITNMYISRKEHDDIMGYKEAYKDMKEPNPNDDFLNLKG